MKRLMLLLFIGLLALSAAFMTGCEEDSAVTDDGDQTILTPEDSSMVEDMLTGDMFSSLNALNLSWELLDSIPGDGAPKFAGSSLALEGGDEDIIITDAGYEGYSDGWHIFDFAAIAVEAYVHDNGVQYYDTVFISGWDSIQVISDGGPIQYLSEQTVIEGLNERVHVNFEDNHDDFSGAINHIIEVDMTYGDVDTILTLNGITDDLLHSGENSDWGACDITMTMEQTITNLVFNVNGDGGCPESGTITSLSTIDAFCTGLDAHAGDTLDVNSSWTVTATFNEGAGTVTVTFTSGGVSWTVTESCEEGGAQASAGWIK